MAGSSSEEAFLDFCERISIEDGFFTKLKRRSTAKKEWRAMDSSTRSAVTALSKAISASDQTAREAKSTIESCYETIERLPKRSRIRRLRWLDTVESCALHSIARGENATQAADSVIDMLRLWKTDSMFLHLLYVWREKVDTFLDEQKRSLKLLQKELHGLKRRTPGRKIIRYATRDDMEALSQKRVDRPPIMERPPPKQRSTTATSWHCRDLGTAFGAINKGVHISVGVDGNGVIVDRTVRKTVLMENSWDWCGNLPREFVTQVVLSGLANAKFVLGVEEWAEARDNNFYHLYLEFAPHGDLFQLAANHRQADRWVPEEFLWLLFQALIESALLMKHGIGYRKQGNQPAWQEMIHRDLKPENIFLALPTKGHFQMYPRPKIADFGGAIFTTKKDPLNPDFYATFGTPGLCAPEQYWYIDPVTEKPVDRFQVLSPCNVWGIGAVMYNLMTLGGLNATTQPPYAISRYPDSPMAGTGRHINQPARHFEAMDIDGQPDIGYETPDEDRPRDDESFYGEAFRYTLRSSVKQRYSAELCDMVNRCMNFHPDSRPLISDLKNWVDDQFWKRSRLKDLNNGRKTVGKAPGPALYEPEKEEYKLGMHWQTLRVIN